MHDPVHEPSNATNSMNTNQIVPSFDSKQAIGIRASTTEADIDKLNLENAVAQRNAEETIKPRSKFRLTLILLALFLSLFITALNSTIVATAIPVITHELKSATGYTWIGGAYLIAHAVGAPIWAKLSDIWGRKVIMLSAVAVFSVGSIVCATATTMRVLIAGRTLQGTASGGLMLLVHVVISDLFSMRQRSLFMGLTEGIWATAGGIGPPLGGVFASLVSWRWCFYVNLPICGIAFALLLMFLDIKHETTSFKAGIKAVDWWGIFSFLAFAIMIFLGLDFGGDIFPWDSARVLCLLIIGLAMVPLFIYCQAKLARYPLIPLSVFKDKSNLAALGVTTFHGLAFFPGEYYMPLYLQAVKLQSPVRSGVLLVPLVVTTAVVGVLTGVVIHRTGRFRELIWMGTALLCIGVGLFIMLDANTSTAEFIGLTIVFGCGSGMLFEPPLIAIQTRTEQQDVATATSTFSFIRSAAIAVSVIIGGVVFQNTMDTQSSQLASAGLSREIVDTLSGKEAAANVALASEVSDLLQRAAIQRAFAFAMRNMWIMYTVLGGMAVLCGLLVGASNLSSEHVETVTGIKAAEVKVNDSVEMS